MDQPDGRPPRSADPAASFEALCGLAVGGPRPAGVSFGILPAYPSLMSCVPAD